MTPQEALNRAEEILVKMDAQLGNQPVSVTDAVTLASGYTSLALAKSSLNQLGLTR